MGHFDSTVFHRRINMRTFLNTIAKFIFFLSAFFGLIVLIILLYRIFTQGYQFINFNFLTGKLSTEADKAGIMGAILGTSWLMLVVTPITFIFGVCTAIYLELYAKDGWIKSFIQTNIANLAGVPSIVYGILGLTVFVRTLQFGNVVLAGGLTMALLILPIIIASSQEAIKSVPKYLGEASYGIGATKWQTVQKVILP